MENKNVLKASAWYTASSFIIKGLGFLTAPIFSRILSQAEYGYFNNFASWLSIITIIATLSLSTSLVRARFDYKEEIDSFVLSILLLGSIFTVVISCVLLINYDFFEGIFTLEYKYIWVMCITMLVSPAYDMFIQVQRFQYKYKLVVFITLSVALSSIVVSLLFIFFFKDNAFARTLGAQLPNIVTSLVIYCYFINKGKKISVHYWKYALCICVPYTFHLLSSVILNSSDRIMITRFCGTESTALYSMAYNIALVTNILWASLNQAYSPWLGEQLNNRQYDAVKKYSYGYIAIFAFVVIGFMLIAPETLMILGGDSYIEAKYVIPPVMLGYLFVFMYSLYVNIEQYENKTVGMAVGTIISTILNVLLNFIFIPKYGYIAAAYTTLIGYIFLFIFHYALVRKMKMHIVYDTKYIVIISIMASLIALLILFVYQFTIIRYIIIAIYIIVFMWLILKKKEFILKLIKK